MSKTIWIFDINHRVYANNRSAPIWKEHWRPHEVVSETSRSWVLDNGRKVTKNIKWPESNGVAFSQREVDEKAWVNDNAYKIAEEVRKLPYDKLTQVNDLLVNPLALDALRPSDAPILPNLPERKV